MTAEKDKGVGIGVGVGVGVLLVASQWKKGRYDGRDVPRIQLRIEMMGRRGLGFEEGF